MAPRSFLDTLALAYTIVNHGHLLAVLEYFKMRREETLRGHKT